MRIVIGRVIYAIAAGILVGLALLLIGTVIAGLGIPIFSTIGKFLEQWCWVIGFLVGLIVLVGGGSLPTIGRGPSNPA